MALSGWGLTPGTLEKNVTRSLGGKYGAVGNNQSTITDMMRQKYSAGLQAKQAKEGFDLTRTAEENRKAESARNFGLETEKFGFTKTQAEKDWEANQRDYALRKQAMEGGWSQQDLDRALREQQMLTENDRAVADLAERIRQADMASKDRGLSLAEQKRASQEAELLRREQLGLDTKNSSNSDRRYYEEWARNEQRYRAGQGTDQDRYNASQADSAQRYRDERDRYDQRRKDELGSTAYGREQDEYNRKRQEEQDAWEKQKYYDSKNPGSAYAPSGGSYQSFNWNKSGLGKS